MVNKAAADVPDEAARWFVRWDDASHAAGLREQSRWVAWLQRSPHHVAAYFSMDDMSARLADSKLLCDLDLDDWMEQRRASVVGLIRSPEARKRTQAKVHRPRLAAVAASALVALSALLAWVYLQKPDSYRTAVGEQRTVQLSDGSTLQLNTRSSADIAYSEAARDITLHGEALFTVSKDLQRPFRVLTRQATVQALGTRFNVYQHEAATRIVVLEGAVQVQCTGSRHTMVLRSGDAAEVTAQTARKLAAANLGGATAWRSRTLIFQGAALAEVAGEFNRYNRMQFAIDPAAGKANRLSGTFDARHPESLLLYLQSRDDLVVTRKGDDYVVRARSHE